MSSKKSLEEMTRQERVDLIINDPETYTSLVAEGHWLQVLDGIKNLPGYEPPK